ncbi:hypothetical protein CC2G_011508 [Coprinopsis cinerea AmutBmut pab1-1]|nr:hypothetical protein CC2G_011508 [Coprinopsis cinerea AmutBmut pab1-1]
MRLAGREGASKNWCIDPWKKYQITHQQWTPSPPSTSPPTSRLAAAAATVPTASSPRCPNGRVLVFCGSVNRSLPPSSL